MKEKVMSNASILKGKHAAVFGAAGSVGSAVAREFAAQGAEVFLSGRTKSSVEELARQIRVDGGNAHAAVIDALDYRAVDQYIDSIANQANSIDIVFNATGPLAKEYGNGKNVVDLTVDEFMFPVATVLKSQFITAHAAARRMVKQHSGVIVFLTGGPARAHVEGTTGIGAAFGAIESLTRNLALDVSPAGVRVVCVRSSAMMDSRTIQQSIEAVAGRMNVTKEQIAARIANLTMLKHPASVSDTAKAAAFLASDQSRMFTGTVLNSSGGAVAD
jgi:NAD(P)-dependent dehydrogenase (short-subunit alcohol dehydrogenase family)